MKHSHHCIKCNSSEILKIHGSTAWGNQNYIYSGGLKPVLVTRYLCGECGYSEEWVDDPKGLVKLQKKYGDKDRPGEFV